MANYLEDLVTEERFPRSELENLKVDGGKIVTGVITGGVVGALAFGIDSVARTGVMDYISALSHSVADAAGYAVLGLGAFHPYLQTLAAGAGIAGGLRYSGASMILAGMAALPAINNAGTVALYYGWGAAAGALTGSLLGILGIYGAFFVGSRLYRLISKRFKKRKKN